MKTCTEKGTEKGKYEIQKSKNRKLKIKKIPCLKKQKRVIIHFLNFFFYFSNAAFQTLNFHYFCLCQKEILARDIWLTEFSNWLICRNLAEFFIWWTCQNWAEFCSNWTNKFRSDWTAKYRSTEVNNFVQT